jgi:alpha-glucosidase
MRSVLDSYPERMMIGEIYLPVHKLVMYYGTDNNGAHLPFNFMLLSLPWDAQRIASAIAEYEGALPHNGWPNWVLGNHDQPRITSRVGMQQARVAAMLLLTLRGTPTIYYGDELGMRDVPIPFEEVQDPQGLNMPDKNLSRDPSRTPMQWTSGEHAGFTSGKPWLRVSPTAGRVNVEKQKNDNLSELTLYRKLIHLRQNEPALQRGDYRPVHAGQQALAYIRTIAGGKSFLVVLNLSHRPCYLNLQQPVKGRVVLSASSELEGTVITERIQLSGDEGIIVELLEGQ